MFNAQFDTPVSQEQNVSFEVRMVRPDRKRPVVRRLFDREMPDVRSVQQLAGFLTHKLFGDNERGGNGTLYHVTVRSGELLDGFTVQRTHDGRYIQV